MKPADEAHVVVVGAGVAGLAAAFASLTAGAPRVTLVSSGPGATALGAGAIDDVPWDEVARAERATSTLHATRASALDAEVLDFAASFGAWDLPRAGEPRCLLATSAGVLRSSRGRARSLLDLARHAERVVLLPRADRAGWDADAIARGLASMAPAGSRFVAIDGPVLRYDDERRASDAALAERHDEAARLDWLAERLRPTIERHDKAKTALLFGPWLGLESDAAAALSSRLGVPVGEVLSASSAVAGLRFERARAGWLARVVREYPGFSQLDRRASAVVRARGRLRVRLDGAAEDASLDASAVVLASGGLIGGGLAYDPPDHDAGPEGPDDVGPSWRLSPRVESTEPEHVVRITTGSRYGIYAAADVVGSTCGPVLDAVAWPIDADPSILERVGVRVDARGLAAPGISAAGDVAFGARRTMLGAIGSGLVAGRAAALTDWRAGQ
ncbi:MAG: FAD-binding protein [Polyangiaceae bacterium]